MTKEKYVQSIENNVCQPITGYSELVIPGTSLWIKYSDETEIRCSVDEIDASCVDNPLTGMTEVVIRLKLKKDEV